MTHCKLALLGSSPLPASNDASHELLHNLERLKQAGIAHVYVQANVTDLEAVRSAVTEAERQLGVITGIFHGAGITQLRSFRDKPLDDFLHCIRIKARGLYNLLAVVPVARLKALHVISSVLGNTGMRGQVDYTFANAWLDGAVRTIKAAHPQIHCLSLGYSVWAETGLGHKIGALDSLRAVGVTAINVKEGVAAYRRLLENSQRGTQFVITGRLTTDLEANLYERPNPPAGRFLEKVLRWIPSTEIVADAKVSHATDLYLPEHVFEGTPMFPGVMAIEAMVQAAMACAARDELPVLRNILFRRPLIVPEDATVVVRTLALAEPAESGTVCVRVAMRSNGDDFQQNHFDAECWFGLPAQELATLPICPALPEPLDKNPEDFNPVPLFQGKFFRRIAAIRRMTPNEESITDLIVPDGERYYSQPRDQHSLTPSPALRDAFLQSGALTLPPGCLPERIKELRFFALPKPTTRVHCKATILSQRDSEYAADYAVFDAAGTLLEQMSGLELRMPKGVVKVPTRRAALPILASRVASDLAELLPNFPHGLALVAHAELRDLDSVAELTRSNIQQVRAEVGEFRHATALANLVATRRAAATFAQRHRNTALTPTQLSLAHLSNGKPELKCDDASLESAFAGIDVTLADGRGISVAVIGAGPLGVDWETVESRDAEQWRGLLGDDGYRLAMLIVSKCSEPFDLAATRVWTLLESGKKANSLQRLIPTIDGPIGGSWLSFVVAESGFEMVSAAIAADGKINAEAVVSLTRTIRSG